MDDWAWSELCSVTRHLGQKPESRQRMSAISVQKLQVSPFYSVKTLADRLGISERTIRSMIASGRLASYRIEGSVRISSEDVEHYLEEARER